MELNQSLNNPLPLPIPSPQLPLQQLKSQFLKKIRYVMNQSKNYSPSIFRKMKNGCGFLLTNQNNKQEALDRLLEQQFQLTLTDFSQRAKQCGFTVRNKVSKNGDNSMTAFLAKQKIFESESGSGIESSSQNLIDISQEEDEFPKDEEVQRIMRQKEEKNKQGFVKPILLFNKAHSEGNSAVPEWKRNDQASIEAKLYEHHYENNSFGFRKQSMAKEEILQKNQIRETSTLADKTLLQKENYQKCSKLIDGTIIELLEAHRSNQIEAKKEGIINKIVEIYDILSDSVENISSVARLFNGKESNSNKRQEIIGLNNGKNGTER